MWEEDIVESQGEVSKLCWEPTNTETEIPDKYKFIFLVYQRWKKKDFKYKYFYFIKIYKLGLVC